MTDNNQNIPCIKCGHTKTMLRHTHAYTYEVCEHCYTILGKY